MMSQCVQIQCRAAGRSVYGRVLLGLWCALLLWQAGSVFGQTNEILVLNVAGTVEVQRAGAAAWDRAYAGQKLAAGDRLRTAERSTAELRMLDATICRIRELSAIEIPGAQANGAISRILSGWIYLFNRDKPGRAVIDSPGMATVIRGTEVAIAVAADGVTTVVLYDGAVELVNEQGRQELAAGEIGKARPGEGPKRTAVLRSGDASAIEWCLYYPAVLHLEDLEMTAEEKRLLESSLTAYRSGNLVAAIERFPADARGGSAGRRLFEAALRLAGGEAETARAILRTVAEPDAGAPLARALERAIDAVQVRGGEPTGPSLREPTTATEWLARSYGEQAAGNLAGARDAARRATELVSDSGHAWARLAELEFSFGRLKQALAAVEQALARAPEHAQAHALHGFILAGRNATAASLAAFERAIALDGRLANGWLGRGLVRYRRGDRVGGRLDLQMAAAMEPQRAILRSYLAKALWEEPNEAKALHEIELARQKDPRDPTPWLYAALMQQDRHAIHDAIRDITESIARVPERGLYRSASLLDQDHAVRSANRALIYQDAGLEDYSVREAMHALARDYTSYAAHLFLANSYDARRDPNQVNLRYETPWLNEYLVANLLAPVGAGILTPTISQNEYAALFERDGLHWASSTEYLTRGDWTHASSQYGRFNRVSYALEAHYRSSPGDQPNGNFEALTLSVQFKAQIAPEDTLYLQVVGYDAESGDVRQVYDPDFTQRNLRHTERQEPLLLAGWRHEWSPDNQTLILLGRLDDETHTSRYSQSAYSLIGPVGGPVLRADAVRFPADFRSSLEIYTAELQHLTRSGSWTWVSGVRAQTGDFVGANTLGRPVPSYPFWFAFDQPAASYSAKSGFDRLSAYAYATWDIVPQLALTAGVAYDYLRYPENHVFPPIAEGELSREQWSPKVGVVWRPWTNAAVRAAYARAMGGASIDQSFRIEPSQVAGFNQSLRSLIPESAAGSIAVPDFDLYGIALDQHFASRTFLGLTAQRLESSAARRQGAFAIDGLPPEVTPVAIEEHIKIRDDTLGVSLGQLLGREFSVVTELRWNRTQLSSRVPAIAPAGSGTASSATDLESDWLQVNVGGIWRSRCGVFAEAYAAWITQENRGYPAGIADEDIWQVNLYGGYRWPRRRAEVRIGLLNALDQDYRLSPLNWHPEWPRERTVAMQVRFNF